MTVITLISVSLVAYKVGCIDGESYAREYSLVKSQLNMELPNLILQRNSKPNQRRGILLINWESCLSKVVILITMAFILPESTKKKHWRACGMKSLRLTL